MVSKLDVLCTLRSKTPINRTQKLICVNPSFMLNENSCAKMRNKMLKNIICYVEEIIALVFKNYKLVSPVAITTRVAPSFLRVGQVELFGRRARKQEHPQALDLVFFHPTLVKGVANVETSKPDVIVFEQKARRLCVEVVLTVEK